jgi:hypothetical protein
LKKKGKKENRETIAIASVWENVIDSTLLDTKSIESIEDGII